MNVWQGGGRSIESTHRQQRLVEGVPGRPMQIQWRLRGKWSGNKGADLLASGGADCISAYIGSPHELS